MDLLDKIGGAATSSERPAKTSRAAPKHEKEIESRLSKMEEILAIVCKISLNNAMQMRAVKSVLMDNMELHSESHAIRIAKEVSGKRSEKQKELKDSGMPGPEVKAKMGTPNTYIVAAWAQTAVDALDAGEQKSKCQAIMTEHLSDRQHIQKYYPFVKVNKTFRAEIKRLEVSVPLKGLLEMNCRGSGAAWIVDAGVVGTDLSLADNTERIPKERGNGAARRDGTIAPEFHRRGKGEVMSPASCGSAESGQSVEARRDRTNADITIEPEQCESITLKFSPDECARATAVQMGKAKENREKVERCLQHLTVVQLRAICKQRKLLQNGKKSDLLARITYDMSRSFSGFGVSEASGGHLSESSMQPDGCSRSSQSSEMCIPKPIHPTHPQE